MFILGVFQAIIILPFCTDQFSYQHQVTGLMQKRKKKLVAKHLNKVRRYVAPATQNIFCKDFIIGKLIFLSMADIVDIFWYLLNISSRLYVYSIIVNYGYVGYFFFLFNYPETLLNPAYCGLFKSIHYFILLSKSLQYTSSLIKFYLHFFSF